MEEIFNFIVNLFVEEGIIIAVAAFVVGQIIKSLKVPNKFIPLIGGMLGAALGMLIPTVFTDKDIITSAVLGLTLGWAATGGYETIKQLNKKGE